MTTMVKVNTNGSYVAEVTISADGQKIVDREKVGPGSSVEKTWHLPHGRKHFVEIEERDASAAEIAASKPAAAAA